MSFVLGIPKKFKYIKVNSLDEALELLRDGSKVLAGGQSLLPLLKLRILNVDTLIDIKNLDLRGVKENEKEIEIYSLTTHNEVASKVKLLSKVAFTIADFQVRNKGTIGGSLAHADPSSNYYPALLTLDAKVKVKSKKGEREIKISDLYLSPYTTSMREDEIITSIIIPKKKELNFTYEVYKRGGSAYPTAIVAVAIEGNKYKVSFGGITEKPTLFEGEVEGESTIKNVIERLRKEKIISDIHADSSTRLKIAERLFVNAFLKALKGVIDKLDIPNIENKWKSDMIRGEEMVKVRMKVNDFEIEDEVEPRTLLLDFLRRNGYKEVKRGCDEGKCGACTVIINGKSIKSCLTLAVEVAGSDIRTVKGLSDIKPIKDSFLENFAMQCGYCTHGFLMVTYDYLKRVGKRDNDELLRHSIKNICRCTGYFNIIKAIKSSSLSQ
ncbi:FAD binding domain-containing protein [Sulfurisphaera tokodaii]|uniref:Oxidoreductase FAD-binding/iron-sulfur subunit n=2 Tax=Sulfurisphaera tokodaii TaxID=111955 RepID=Q976U6_SULTO|nr:FAD binding domain-containing protein [Sulfurisphaera tokodaii]BAB65050.1 oxidoreductase FAD-binding/iron-sulfur subunit [Sulfurisphaera tokodaii str. 7]HII74232.1 2Fe-2S iron-sulfur cluster binding domain-containing protein [Sulfurisphaera tokodaii]